MSPAKLKLLQISAGLNLAFAATTACALPYTIDGLFADWGVNSTTLQSSTARKQTIEDQHDSYLNPGYGGQKYDAEAMYLDWDANYLYVGILTGLPSNNPHNPAGNSYGPGDIILDFGLDNNPEFAFKVITRNGLTKGKVYQPLNTPTTWHYGIWSAPNVLANGSNPSTDVVAIKRGTQQATGELAYSTSWVTNLGQWTNDKHYFIEAKIPTSAFGAMWMGDGPRVALDVHWAAMCANDIITADPAPVSEPATGGLLGLAVGSVAWFRRRARK